MSTVGVGLDLVEVSRVERLLRDKGEAVYAKLLTTDERAYVVGQPRLPQLSPIASSSVIDYSFISPILDRTNIR